MNILNIFRSEKKKVSALSQILSGKEISRNHPNVVYLASSILGEYGAVLEKTSNVPIGVSDKLLPYSKSEIQEAIVLLLSFLNSKDSWDAVEQKYPYLSKFILTNEYYKSLRTGYIELSKFITEKDAELCAKASKLLSKDEEYNVKSIDDLAQEIGSPWFEKVVKINKRITEESLVRLAYIYERYGEKEHIFIED